MLALLEKWLLGRLLARFFAAVPGSISGHVNAAELVRVLVAALAAGGGMAALSAAVLGDVSAIFAPGDVTLATAAIVGFSELYRRLGHGSQPPIQVSIAR